MDNSDFRKTAERYKKEMLELYGAKPTPAAKPESVPAGSDSVSSEANETQDPNNIAGNIENQSLEANQTEAPNNKAGNMENQSLEANQTENPYNKTGNIENQGLEANQTERPVSEAEGIKSIDERFPPPELPEFIKANAPAENNDSFGYLKVSVKTGNGGLPLAGSLVTVSEIKDGKENIIKIMNTDSSGATEILKLPAPKNYLGNTPQGYEQFSKYNISAYNKGYFRETSVDAPIFDGITSIQNFNLIPEPFEYDSGDNVIVDSNQEPEV
ncbi:MAG: hypothetical protein ACI4JB_03370 [Porcipelethomonas sp.]